MSEIIIYVVSCLALIFSLAAIVLGTLSFIYGNDAIPDQLPQEWVVNNPFPITSGDITAQRPVILDGSSSATQMPIPTFVESVSGAGLHAGKADRLAVDVNTLPLQQEFAGNVELAITDAKYETVRIVAPWLRGWFAQTAAGPVVANNTTALQQLSGSGKGTMTIPANTFRPSFALQLKAAGQITASPPSLQNFTFAVKRWEGDANAPDLLTLTVPIAAGETFPMPWSLDVSLTGILSANDVSLAATLRYGEEVTRVQSVVGLDYAVANTLRLFGSWDQQAASTHQASCLQYVIWELNRPNN